jgi:hypothetical protein
MAEFARAWMKPGNTAAEKDKLTRTLFRGGLSVRPVGDDTYFYSFCRSGFRAVTTDIAGFVRSVWTGGSGIAMIARSARMDFPFRVSVEGFRIRTMTR